MQVIHCTDLRLHHFFEAVEARLERRIKSGVFDRNPKARRREYCILLCVNADTKIIALSRAKLISASASFASACRTVLDVFWRPVVPRRDHSIFSDQDRSHLVAETIRSLPDFHGDFHELLGHCRTGIRHPNPPRQKYPRRPQLSLSRISTRQGAPCWKASASAREPTMAPKCMGMATLGWITLAASTAS